MIRSQDLRIRNLVNHKTHGEICVIGISPHCNEYKIDTVNGWVYLKNCKPIPLTEEWLLKFGFDNLGTFGFARGDFKLEFTKNIMTKQDCDYVLWVNSRIIRFYSVHQLQNLYFALTNKELSYERI